MATAPEPRRTVRIQGRGAERHMPPPRRGAAWRAAGPRIIHSAPDRIALWAVMLGVVLLLVAVTSSH
jgi:hypothetical protein